MAIEIAIAISNLMKIEIEIAIAIFAIGLMPCTKLSCCHKIAGHLVTKSVGNILDVSVLQCDLWMIQSSECYAHDKV